MIIKLEGILNIQSACLTRPDFHRLFFFFFGKIVLGHLYEVRLRRLETGGLAAYTPLPLEQPMWIYRSRSISDVYASLGGLGNG